MPDNMYQYKPLTFPQYFSAAYAYARGSTRFTSIPFIANAFQEAALADDLRAIDLSLYSAAGYISERGPLHFTVPFYSTKSRVRIQADLRGIAKIACRSGGTTAASRLSHSAGDDAQLGYFLGSPPLLYPYEKISDDTPFSRWDPALLDKVYLAPDSTINVGNALDVFVQNTVDVSSSSGLDVSVNNIPNVSVVGTVSATIPDNTPVIIRGLDSSSTPQTFAALPNRDGNHTISASVNSTDVITGDIVPLAAADISGGGPGYNLGTVTIL